MTPLLPTVGLVLDLIAVLIAVPRLTAELTAISGLQCYICDSASFISYSDAEAECNTGNLHTCSDTKHSACMIEAFKRDGPVYHVIKKCRKDCPVLINSTAQHIRCCFKDACNDVITIGSASNDISAQLELEQPTKDSLPTLSAAKQPASTDTTTTTTDWASETPQLDDNDLVARTFSRPQPPPTGDLVPPAVPRHSTTTQRSTTSEAGASRTTTPSRRRWHPRRGRYPPSYRNNRYGRRPPYRSAGHRAIQMRSLVKLLAFIRLATLV